ncbi:MAG: tRNA uridine-5-carboxymethylaminomethyl(34) synthesis GTPase MnmE [Actinobacteria bacterium]|nr:MAG: tRNA uridine-5-carboxymethylaminomethyl(34) synthesis GTPase MnmE [Actinomycetota bacterium]
MYFRDTIAAISTPCGKSGIGIIKISGDKSIKIASSLFKPSSKSNLSKQPAFKVSHGLIVSGAQIIDEVLVTVMRAPKSYTAEDVVEINCHGSLVSLSRVLEMVLDNGARLADPGEFTRRAYLNGRIDLAQAEAVADVINSKTQSSLEAAMDQLKGPYSKEIGRLRAGVLRLLAQVEAAVDFSDEEDISLQEYTGLRADTKNIVIIIEQLLSSSRHGKILRDGLVAAIIGAPNVGKSSLLNLLLREERAIVSPIPGTTRDVIEEYVNIRGIPLALKDTAGIRKTKDQIEILGVRLSKKSLEQADLVLWVIDNSKKVTAAEAKLSKELMEKKVLVVMNKSDLKPKNTTTELKKKLNINEFVKMSALTGFGLNQLEERIAKMVFAQGPHKDKELLVTNVRHIRALEMAKKCLDEADELLKNRGQEELISLVLREAADDLGLIIGQTTNDDILEEIFSTFCIGK